MGRAKDSHDFDSVTATVRGMYYIEQHAGELLFLPAGYIYVEKTLDATVGIRVPVPAPKNVNMAKVMTEILKMERVALRVRVSEWVSE